MGLHGKMLVEISEMNSFNRAEVTRIKQVMTTLTDRFRAPYARTTQDYPRQSIFVGTTNEESYLRDSTGGGASGQSPVQKSILATFARTGNSYLLKQLLILRLETPGM